MFRPPDYIPKHGRRNVDFVSLTSQNEFLLRITKY